MLLNNLPGGEKAQAGTLAGAFCTEKIREYSFLDLVVHADAIVTDQEEERAVFLPRGECHQTFGPLTDGARIQCIRHQIDQARVNPILVHQSVRDVRLQVSLQLDALQSGLVLE